MTDLVSIRGWFAQSLCDGLKKFANEMHFSDIIVEVNKSIQKKYHTLTGHRQSIEYHTIAPNKNLYFKLNLKMNDRNQPKNFKSKWIEKINPSILKNIIINEISRKISFNPEGRLNIKYLIEIANLKYKHFDKYFKVLTIENNFLESIEESDFGEIGVDEVNLQNCPNLKQIHWNVFGQHSGKIQLLNLSRLPNLISYSNSDYNLFKLINSAVNCEEIKISPFHNELQPIILNNLIKLDLNGFDSLRKIKSICDYAFYECFRIQEINLSCNSISEITENVFHFRKTSDKLLKIDLRSNLLNELSFESNSLVNLKRPAEIYLYGNKIEFIYEEMTIAKNNLPVKFNYVQQNQINKVKIRKGLYEENFFSESEYSYKKIYPKK